MTARNEIFEQRDQLTLYHFDACPYCARVRNAIADLGIDDIEFRDIREDKNAYDELVAARGTRTVPVLRIQSADGNDQWMPESADIIRWLEARSARPVSD